MSSPSEVFADDASLLAASRRGDVQAFGQLVERYHNLVTAIAYSRTGDRAISDCFRPCATRHETSRGRATSHTTAPGLRWSASISSALERW